MDTAVEVRSNLAWIKCEIAEPNIESVRKAIKWCKNTLGPRGAEWKHTWGSSRGLAHWSEFYFSQAQDAMLFKLMFC